MLQIGGTLAKLVYVSRDEHSPELGDRLHFAAFETASIDDCIEFMSHLKDTQHALNQSAPKDLRVVATGGGAFKFYDRIREKLGIEVQRGEEMQCLITGEFGLRSRAWCGSIRVSNRTLLTGLDFFITEIPREVFTYTDTGMMEFVQPRAGSYPYMLVNIGSGVSMLKVSGPQVWERVGGTSLGGATFRGILSLLTPAKSFDEMLDMAARGDNKKVDMLVGDIYGTDYNKIGLKSTAIASSFGKVFRREQETSHDTAGDSAVSNPGLSGDAELFDPTTPDFDSADISRALLYAISNNIAQIAFLQSQIHGLSDIYFGGSFINGHPQTIERISVAIKYWSKGEKEAYFLRHEGYLGAVGAFLQPEEQ